MRDYFIGVDIGTGSVKAVGVNPEGQAVTSNSIPYSMLTSEEGYSEQDPEIIFTSFLSVIKAVTTQMGYAPSAIGVSSAMHSLLLLDVNSEPITPLITWADNRAGDIARKFRNDVTGEQLYVRCGTPLHAMSPIFKIRWFKDNKPDTFNKTAKFVSIKEFIWWKLFGEFEADYSVASATGLMDIISLQWDKLALDIAGITTDKLSTLVNTDFSRNRCNEPYATTMGLTDSAKFIIGGSDGCMANLGSFATRPGIGALTIGTSGALRIASTKPVYDFDAMIFNYRLDAETFICGGPTNNGGVVLKWYAENILGRQLLNDADYDTLLGPIHNIAPGANNLTFLPYILGERAPLWNVDASGVFFGLKKSHTQAHLTRAVIEGICMALFDICHTMGKGGLAISEINVSGGFIKSAEWVHILSEIFGVKLKLFNVDDASALGAAYLAMKAVGKIDSVEQLTPKDAKELIADKAITALYQKQHDLFRKLYRNLSSLMA